MTEETPNRNVALDIRVNQVPPEAILLWLAKGWRDVRAAGIASLVHGLIVSLLSIAITVVAFFYWELLPGAVSGFVIIGPLLATGLYALSSRIEKSQSTSFRDVINVWLSNSRCLLMFGFLLVLASTAWVVFSFIMFHFFIDADIRYPIDFLKYVLTQDNGTFLLWTMLGGLGSALAFAITVVALPLLVDRDICTRDAVYASVRAVSANPGTMVLWAMTILIITGISFVTLMLGFIVLYPLMGHASWHAYRDLVDADAVPPRQVLSSHG